MTLLKLQPLIRRLGRVALLLLLGYPLLVIGAPLLVGLTFCAIVSWTRLGQSGHWSATDVFRGMGLSILLVLLASLAVMHLVAVVYVNWKGHSAVYRSGRWQAVSRPWLHAVISREGLTKCIDVLIRDREVIGPVARTEPTATPPLRHFYQPIQSAAVLDLAFPYCVYGPKSAVLPPHETLIEFNRTNGHFESTVHFDDRPRAIVGVHPCDIHAIRLLDKVFTTDHVDTHYQRRRNCTLIVGMDCPAPCTPEAFCRDMQTDTADRGFDVMLYPLSRDPQSPRDATEFGVVFDSQAGRDWLTPQYGELLRDPTMADERHFEEYLERKRWAFPKRLAVSSEQLPAVVSASYDSLEWGAAAKHCYSCGSCNLVCPTCYCFDISDRLDFPPRSGTRERMWDACMLHDFSVVAGGHNFRAKTAERLRHRVFRKAKWINQRTGLCGCVGCGRCDRACTAKISIVRILNQLAEESRHLKRSRTKPAQEVAS